MEQMNYSGTQLSYGNRSGIQTSQLISRNAKTVDSIPVESVSENLNRFLFNHSRKNVTHGSRKFRLSDYIYEDLKAKTFSTHHLLCGPLNTKRLTRKTIAGNFDEPTAIPLSVNELYNSKQIHAKPPWIEESEPELLPENQSKPLEPEVDSSFEFNHRFSDKFCDNAVSTQEQIPPDGEVPDPMHVDLRDSCPLYDSSEYEQCSSPVNVQKDGSDDEKSEPDISRYNFFVGGYSEKLPVDDRISDSTTSKGDNDKKSVMSNDDENRPKRLTREEKFKPLITWPRDDVEDSDEFFIMEYVAAP